MCWSPHTPIYLPNHCVNWLVLRDSYWIMEGLLLCEMNDTVRGMIENLVQMVEWSVSIVAM